MARNKRKKHPRVVPTVGTAVQRRTIARARHATGQAPIALRKSPVVGPTMMPGGMIGRLFKRGRRGA